MNCLLTGHLLMTWQTYYIRSRLNGMETIKPELKRRVHIKNCYGFRNFYAFKEELIDVIMKVTLPNLSPLICTLPQKQFPFVSSYINFLNFSSCIYYIQVLLFMWTWVDYLKTFYSANISQPFWYFLW